MIVFAYDYSVVREEKWYFHDWPYPYAICHHSIVLGFDIVVNPFCRSPCLTLTPRTVFMT